MNDQPDQNDDVFREVPESESAAFALALGAASRAKADAFLDAQTAIAGLQKAHLHEQRELAISHLKWRRFNDQMKGALQIMIVLVGALIVFGLAASLWNASQSDGLVVDSFAVPPQYAQGGFTGSVMADDMTQKIAAIRDFANENSLARSKDVREARDQEIKAEIPETGISMSEAWRYLRLWLGNEQHLNGNLRVLPGNKVALTVSLGGSDTFTFTGKPDDLDSLEQKAAERVFATVDPINYVLYLDGKGRNAETLAAAARNLSLSTDNKDLGEAHALYANMVRYITGDVRLSLAHARIALALDPRGTPQHMEMLLTSRTLGHDEDVLTQARDIASLRLEDNVGSWRTGNGFPFVQQLGAINRAAETGDFTNLSTLPCLVECSPGEGTLRHAEALARMHDTTQASHLVAEQQQVGAFDAAHLSRAQYFIHAEKGDWRGAVTDARGYAQALLADKSVSAKLDGLFAQTLATPLLAHALTASDDIAAARKTIDGTHLDCYGCLRERGNIDAYGKNWNGAAYWFARAVSAGPSVPFAYFDWGVMLLAKGDYDAAIGKLREANLKGPHWADPLELWAEALMLKNRSDLALAKFEEAGKYAPNWGHLHLAWGKALSYDGQKDEAQKRYTLASRLDLSRSDRTQLEELDKQVAGR
jgi:tetratricopeptide (TPR) repeat protein